MQVVVVKRAGVTAYEEVAEEFGERCRVRARVVSFGDEGAARPPRLARDDLVVTVGQEALDAVERRQGARDPDARVPHAGGAGRAAGGAARPSCC